MKRLFTLLCLFVMPVIGGAYLFSQDKPEIVIQSGHTNAVNSVAISADGKYIVSGSWDNTVRLWDLATGKEIRRFEGHTSIVNSVAISADGKYIVSGSGDNTVRLWDMATGKEIRRFAGHTESVYSVVISADGKYIVSGSGDNTVRLWDRASGKETRRFEGHTGAVTSAAISADGLHIISGSLDNTVRLWGMAAGQEIRRFEGHTGWVSSVAISADGNYIVSGSWDKTVRLWDTATGKELRRFDGHTSGVNSVAISADGNYIVSGSLDNTVRLWDMATGNELRRFAGHTGWVRSVAISRDGRYIVSGSQDGEIKIWHAVKGNLLASLVVFKDGEWMAYTPANYYICSPNGEQYVTFRVGNKIYNAAKYPQYRNVGAVARAINPGSFSPVNTKIRPPVIIINFLQSEDKRLDAEDQIVAAPEIKIKAAIADDYYGINRVIIQLNGVAVVDKKVPGDNRFYIDETIALNAKENRVKIIAYNSENARGESREIKLTYKQDTLEELMSKGKNIYEILRSWFGKQRSWAVVIGIDKYKTENGFEKLEYAVNDAVKVRQYLVDELGFDKDKVIPLDNEKATKHNIEQKLGDFLPKEVDVNDRVVIYFSGHGAIRKGKNDESFGYLIPYDGTEKSLYSTCIEMSNLCKLSLMIPAKQVLIILDCCYSGMAGFTFKAGKELPKDIRGQVELFIKTEGRQLITAGASGEKVVMSEKWKNHSVFTYYLLEGLKGGADYDKNKLVTIYELKAYLDEKVSKEADQHPQLRYLSNSEGQFVFYKEGEY